MIKDVEISVKVTHTKEQTGISEQRDTQEVSPYNIGPIKKLPKTEKGISVKLPFDLYKRITMLKYRTNTSIQDLALQAISEFLDRQENV